MDGFNTAIEKLRRFQKHRKYNFFYGKFIFLEGFIFLYDDVGDKKDVHRRFWRCLWKK